MVNNVIIKYILIIILILVIIRLIYLFELRRSIRNLFISLIKNLENANVEYWIDYGTLLGITRDKDIIMGDNDADICIINTPENMEKCKKVVEIMNGKYLDWGAFRVYSNFFNISVFVDIYIPIKNDNEYKNPAGGSITIDLIEPIQKKEITIGGTTIVASVPNKIKNVLIKRYGENWMKNSRTFYTLYFDIHKDILNDIGNDY